MLHLLGDTFLEPTETFRTVLKKPVSRIVLIQCAALLAAIAGVVEGLMPIPESVAQAAAGPGGAIPNKMPPILGAAVHFLSTLLTAGLMSGVGRIFGGIGNFDRALFASVWLSAAFLIPGMIVFFIGVAIPGAYGFCVLTYIIWQGVVLTRAVQVVHDFPQFMPTLFGVLGTAFLLGIAAVFLAGLAGVGTGT